MTVTFSLATRRPDGVIDGVCPDYDAHRVCTVASMEHIEDLDMYGCCDCFDANEAACGFCSLSVNVSNTNARMLLANLGIECDDYDLCGSLDPADFLGRTLVGAVGVEDTGITPSTVVAPGRATMTDCGLAPGYYERTFGRLADLATEAVRRGALISWG